MTVHGLIDRFMQKLMKSLGLKIPKFYITRYCKLSLDTKGGNLLVKGVDENLAPYSCFTQVTLMSGKTRLTVKREPFAMPVPKGAKEFDVILYSYGHYKEPGCKIHVNLAGGAKAIVYQIMFDPALPEKGWVVTLKA